MDLGGRLGGWSLGSTADKMAKERFFVEKRHETSASSISASGRRRCCIAGPAATGIGARLNVT